ncbi:MAG: DUF4331 family protein, partial [Dehalococcoidia bacterium]
MLKASGFTRLGLGFLMVGILGLILTFGMPSDLVRGADHLDAPSLTSPGGDGRLDINDVYAFVSPTDSDKTVLIMTVNPGAGALSPVTFHPKAKYEFLIDNDGDAKEDKRIVVSFKDRNGGQELRAKGPGFNIRGSAGGVIEAGAIKVATGVYDDPFFFDLDAFLGTGGRAFCDGGQLDFFAGLNVSAIVLELPSRLLHGRDAGDSNIGVWARTFKGGQVDRMGRPAINTVFIPANPFEPNEESQKNAFNEGKPKNDQQDFRDEIVDTLALFYAGGDPTIDALADILLPDILTYDTSDTNGFLNGRRLADDVIDAEL